MDATPILNGHPRSLPRPPAVLDGEATEGDAEAAGIPRPRPHLIEPLPVSPPRRKLALVPVDLSMVNGVEPVSHLAVRDLKGPGGVFTPNLSLTLKLAGIVYKSTGTFEPEYQLLAPPLNQNPRLARLTKILSFIPAFAWASFEVVLLPLPMTIHGNRVFADLSKLTGQFAMEFKVFKQWDQKQSRYAVSRVPLSDGDRDRISRIQWPTREEMLEVLQEFAFDDLQVLAAANDDVRTILASIEVV